MLNKVKEIVTAYARMVNPTEEQKRVAEIRLQTCMGCEFWAKIKLASIIVKGADAPPKPKYSAPEALMPVRRENGKFKIIIMPYSYGEFKDQVRDHIVDNFPRDTKILDVGAGSGTYGNLLKEHYDRIDALEIFPEYIKMFGLEEIYTNVYAGNILTFDVSDYDYIIMGDVLEHILPKYAMNLMRIFNILDKKLMIAVPYNYEQGEEFGNIYETHHQPDLTIGTMYQRYPMLRLLYGDNKYGYYINYIPPIK